MLVERSKDATSGGLAPSIYYVYMVDGSVSEVGPEDGIRVSDDAVEVVLGDRLVAWFDRRRVFTCSRDIQVSLQLG